MARTGRPLKREVDFEFIKKIIQKGFTVDEASLILNMPKNTIQYYTRTRKLGKFERYKIGKYDNQILKVMEDCNYSATEAAKILNLSQPHIYMRYKKLKDNQGKREERYQWLMKQGFANDVVKNLKTLSTSN